MLRSYKLYAKSYLYVDMFNTKDHNNQSSIYLKQP